MQELFLDFSSSHLLAGLLTLPITAALTIAGVGAAFILIPVFTALGIELQEAMAVALFLNALAMSSASIRYARKKLILWKLGLPLILTSSIGARIGVKLAYSIDNSIIRIFFIGFLLFAAFMFFFSKKKGDGAMDSPDITPGRIVMAGGVGLGVGVLSGLIGVGGGNIILPILVALGIRSKQAVGTTAIVVVFTSISGFASHMGADRSIALPLILITACAAILGAVIGSWLMTDKLNPRVVKKILGCVLIAVAVKMIINLFSLSF